MEPLWEYQYWIFDGPRRGMKQSPFFLTDEEAARWPRLAEDTTKRIDESKRDRNLHPSRMHDRDISTSAFQRNWELKR